MQSYTLLHLCPSVTYILWSSDFVLYMCLEDYLKDECCTGDIDSSLPAWFALLQI